MISLTCLLIKKDHRGQGLASALITAVCNYLADAGETRVMEAYPIEPPQGRKAGADNPMTGIASAFLAAGFAGVALPRSDRPVM